MGIYAWIHVNDEVATKWMKLINKIKQIGTGCVIEGGKQLSECRQKMKLMHPMTRTWQGICTITEKLGEKKIAYKAINWSF